MNTPARVRSFRSSIEDFARRSAIPGAMMQNLMKEAIHYHVLSALQESGVFEHVVFQGGTAIHLCWRGDRYSEDLDFAVRGDQPLDVAVLADLVEQAAKTTRRTISRDFGIDPETISVRPPKERDPSIGVRIDTWQISVPIDPTDRSPKSKVKIEFANVTARQPIVRKVRSMDGLVQVPAIYVPTESVDELIADKCVALLGRPVVKHRDIWDIAYLSDDLRARIDYDLVLSKLDEYNVEQPRDIAEERLAILRAPSYESSFHQEMSRFLPPAALSGFIGPGLAATVAHSADLLEGFLLATSPTASPGR